MPRVLATEILKLRRTLALWVSLLCPLVVVLLAFAVSMRFDQPFSEPRSAWNLVSANAYSIWALLMLPLFVALVTTLTGHLEWAGSQWKHLFALPIPRWRLYAAKLVANLLLCGLATLALIGWTLLAGLLLWAFKRPLGVELGPPPPTLFVLPFATLLAALLLVALHSWISMRFAAVVTGLGVGVAGSVGTLLVTGSRYIDEYPWSFPIYVTSVVKALLTGEPSAFAGGTDQLWVRLAIFTVVAVAIALLGAWSVCRREIR